MRLFQAVVLSLVIHFLLVFLAEKVSPYFETKPRDVTEVELVEKKPDEVTKVKPPPLPPKPKQQIVRQALAPDKLLREEDETLARFLSAQKQRVREESQARMSGMTQNRNESNSRSQQQKQQKTQALPQQPQNAPKDYDPNGIDITKNLKEYQQMQAQQSAPSTVGEALPQDVKVGSFTALNTDRFTYYSFFARVEELIRFRWESRIRDFIDANDRAYVMNVLARHNWVTEVDIWLTRDGRFHSSHLMHESGIPKFDAAAINAFREAGMFPNPPQDMVESDGFIHLKYGFDVNLNPSALVSQ